jgi:hypothetical protein
VFALLLRLVMIVATMADIRATTTKVHSQGTFVAASTFKVDSRIIISKVIFIGIENLSVE